MQPVARRRIGEIQWLRAAAALMVVAAHIKVALDLRYFQYDMASAPLSPFPFVAGVDIFFVISGFVMAYASEGLHGRSDAWRRFLVRRLARVAPLYWLMTLLLIGLMIAIRAPDWPEITRWQIAASFLFVPTGNVDGYPFPLLDVGWTLNYEMMFYVVFALFVGLRQRWALLATALVLVGIVALGRIEPMPTIALRFWTDPVVLEFLGGIGIFLLFRTGLTLPLGVRVALAAAAVVGFFCFPLLDFTWRFLQWGVPACLLVLAAVTGRGDRHSPAAEWAGDISYAIYLSHFFVIRIALQIFERTAIQSPLLWLVGFPLLVLGGTLVASALLHRLFEKPVLRFIRDRFDRRVTAGPGAAPGL
ncbi:acyltransferase [Aureimonas sp. AU12]|uniref:acyltransferase family protein n=1 Tax=Aureimonas sp. AU12 TaxID=1638161 RepID=UPI00078535D0|nr:acyltransferase [Aureimonas sp. AU12]